MNLEDLKDKSISMILWNLEKEDDVCVYLGKLQLDDKGSYFINERQGWKVSLNKDQLNRIKPVQEELKEMFLRADYAFSMYFSDLPETADPRELISTRIKWRD